MSLKLAPQGQADTTMPLCQAEKSLRRLVCGAPGWAREREPWKESLPNTANPPKSACRTAAEGNPLQRRRILGMIHLGLGEENRLIDGCVAYTGVHAGRVLIHFSFPNPCPSESSVVSPLSTDSFGCGSAVVV